MPAFPTGPSWLRRAVVVSLVVHGAIAAIVGLTVDPVDHAAEESVIDIDLAPAPPPVEALPPEEVAALEAAAAAAKANGRADEANDPGAASSAPSPEPDEPGAPAADAMPPDAPPADAPAPDAARVDAAPPDAPKPDAPKPDAAARPDAPNPDAPRPDAAPLIAATDDAAPAPDAGALAITDDAGPGSGSGSNTVATGSGSGSNAVAAGAGSGSGSGSGSNAVAAGAGSGSGSGSNAVAASAGSGSGSGSGSNAVAAGSGSGSGSNAVAASAGSGARASDVAAGSGSSAGSNPVASGAGSGLGPSAAGSGSGVAGTENLAAVPGATTSVGTAANLIAYFPAGHVVTALIRFDRLRGTEWGATAERLLRPMPDYQVLFGTSDAKIVDKLDTLVISSPAPRDASATTLVAHVSMDRANLRTFLNAGNPVAWSAAKGGLLGRRTGRTYQNDRRVFLSPFRGWFVLGQPADFPGLLAPATGSLDSIEAPAAALPPWLAKIRTIEAESGTDKPGPALVVTLAFDGKAVTIPPDEDFGLGLGTVQVPQRVSLALELVKQGWLARGNIKFASDAEAAAFLATVTGVRQRILDNKIMQLAIGKAAVHFLEHFQFAQGGPRVSFASSLSIHDARDLMAFLAQQLDSYFAAAAAQPPVHHGPPGTAPAPPKSP